MRHKAQQLPYPAGTCIPRNIYLEILELILDKCGKKKMINDIMNEIPTKTGGASPSTSSFQNLTFRKNVSALPL